MLSPDLNRLIEASLTDGVLTEQERAVIKKRALLEGIDPDEVDILLESRLQEMHKKAEEAVAKVRKCPACGAIISYMQTVCPQCGNEITNIGAAKSVQKLSDMINEVTATEYDKEKRQERLKNLIKSFPVPTTKEDIMEFLFMAAPNAKKNKSLLGKFGPVVVVGGGVFAAIFVLGLILGLADIRHFGQVFGICLMNAFWWGIISGGIAHFAMKKRMEPIREQNRMADVWKAKCEQVLAKAKFTLRNDENAMNTIRDIEIQLNSKK